jgi:hypothetical protein
VTDGSEAERIARAVDATVTVIAVDAARLGLLLSLTVAVNVEDPLAVGIPEIVPEAGSRLRPPGSLPAVIAHLYPGVPPLARKACEYDAPPVAGGKAEVAMVNGLGARTMVNGVDCVCIGLPLSRTPIVKAEVPLDVGVPEITPVDAMSDSPAGRLPEVTDQE